MSGAARALLLCWYGPLLGGLVPILLLGFLYSAIADRLAFVGWGLVLAAAYTMVLRQGVAAGWTVSLRTASLAFLLAAGLASFAALERVHHEILDLGFRAVLPGLYHPAATRPASAFLLAAALALTGCAALAIELQRLWRGRTA